MQGPLTLLQIVPRVAYRWWCHSQTESQCAAQEIRWPVRGPWKGNGPLQNSGISFKQTGSGYRKHWIGKCCSIMAGNRGGGQEKQKRNILYRGQGVQVATPVIKTNKLRRNCPLCTRIIYTKWLPPRIYVPVVLIWWDWLDPSSRSSVRAEKAQSLNSVMLAA